MLTGLIVTIVMLLFFVFFAIYKRDMISKMFTLHTDTSRIEFQHELEHTADKIIKRLEDQIAHLEYLLEEADAKLELLDKKIQVAESAHQLSAKSQPTLQSVERDPAVDILIQAPPSELELIKQPYTTETAKTTAVDPPNNDRRRLIMAMADQGYSVTEIAKATGLGKGEIMLLLQLNKR